MKKDSWTVVLLCLFSFTIIKPLRGFFSKSLTLSIQPYIRRTGLSGRTGQPCFSFHCPMPLLLPFIQPNTIRLYIRTFHFYLFTFVFSINSNPFLPFSFTDSARSFCHGHPFGRTLAGLSQSPFFSRSPY